ncbi:Na/Pi cotransporter family protein [Paracraurococcus lichenis]|uniref:Na/Pi cotransporter family protein n=1 Tax=Paracraurococcus lichenis TaxID=3064888 RepID=A0ABT9EA01_9PROT|nr:Na/Pi cotransporter family protein [Paracraurococcus sp. LOR1-02]MDO9712934.1 Na/Pi cotransporter family protein [Paracraurococcus sp. LOR1-02]
MNVPLMLVDLAGSVALLLWGVRMVQTGVQRAFGPRLRAVLASALRTRLSAFFAGLGVTAVLQSSTATGLMVTGLAAGGVVELVPALAVMLGANVGTTLIVQALSFDVSRVAPALVALGFLMFRRGDATRTRDLGRVVIGLGLMLMALHQLLEIITPYETAPALRSVLDAISAEPLVAIVLAAALTWATHSSVAVVLLVMSLAAKGIASPEAAFVLVLGANLGTAINPVLEGATGDDPATRRLPLGNLLNRVLGCAMALVIVPYLAPLVMAVEPHAARAVADFHTAFNLALAVLFFPVLHPYAALLRRLLPARLDQADPSRPMYLDKAAIETPVVAIGAAAREALRLADVLEAMLQGVQDAFEQGDRKRIAETRRLDDVLDRLNEAIKVYVASLEAEAMTDADRRRVDQVLAFAMNIEHAGDVVDKNLAALASKRLKRGLAFSREGQAELSAMMGRLTANLRTAASVFVTEDPRAARLLAAEKEAFRDLEAAATQAHVARLREGLPETAETSALHLDVVRDLKRVNAHLVEAAAYPILQAQGELLPTRLRTED